MDLSKRPDDWKGAVDMVAREFQVAFYRYLLHFPEQQCVSGGILVIR